MHSNSALCMYKLAFNLKINAPPLPKTERARLHTENNFLWQCSQSYMHAQPALGCLPHARAHVHSEHLSKAHLRAYKLGTIAIKKLSPRTVSFAVISPFATEESVVLLELLP